MADSNFDVIVIGGGPAGYVAAIRCAQLGMRVACVDAWQSANGKPSLGGTCLNVGCIPSKALLDSSHLYAQIAEHAAEHGIACHDVALDVSKMQSRKNKIVATLTRGIESLLKKNGVTQLHGQASLLALGAEQKISVHAPTGSQDQQYTSAKLIIATGSAPVALADAPFDGDRIVDSSSALNFSEVPKRLGIVGAGVIGLELGSVWRRLGAEVVMLEAMDTFLPAADQAIAAEAQKAFKKQGLDIRLGSKLKRASVNNAEVSVEYENAKGAQTLAVDKLIVACGRSAYTQGLGTEAAGIKLDAKGFIVVDEFCRTNQPGVYAIGDVVRGPMLAHKGAEEGVAVAEHIAGSKIAINHDLTPWVIYTWPEIAWVGKTEQALKAANIDYRVGEFPFAASGRAKAMGEAAGRIKVLADAKTDRVLGVHCFGPQASELIAEAVTVMAFEGSAEDIARTVHAHPSLSESLREAALGVSGRAIHF